MIGKRLNCAPVLKPLQIISIEGSHDVKRRLAVMGLRKGVDVRLIHATDSGPAVIEIHGGQLVLDADMAEKIVVA